MALVTASETAVLISAISSMVGSNWAKKSATAILAKLSLEEWSWNCQFHFIFYHDFPPPCPQSLQACPDQPNALLF